MSAEPQTAGAELSRGLARSFALHAALRALEALALGWLAAACVLAAVSVTTSRAEPLQAWIAAAIAGACCAATWWIEAIPDRAAHVRAVDRRLELDGALVTAEGIGATRSGGRLALLLVSQVAARVRGSELARASLPRTPLLLVASILGTAVLFAARDADSRRLAPALNEPDAAVGQALGAAAGALRSAAARAAESGASSGAQQVGLELAGALESAARNPRTLATAGPALEERLIEAARAARAGKDGAPALTAALAALEQARRQPGRIGSASTPGMSDSRSSGSAVPDASASAAGPTTTGAGVSGRGSSPDATFPGSALASSGSDGRMAAPDPAADTSSTRTRPVPASGGPELGVADVRWWPARYDRIVQAWLEPARPGEHE